MGRQLVEEAGATSDLLVGAQSGTQFAVCLLDVPVDGVGSFLPLITGEVTSVLRLLCPLALAPRPGAGLPIALDEQSEVFEACRFAARDGDLWSEAGYAYAAE